MRDPAVARDGLLSALAGAIVCDRLPFGRVQSILDRMPRLIRLLLVVAALPIVRAARVDAQQTVSPAVRAEIQARAGRYPLVAITIFAHDSALLEFADSSYTGKAYVAGTWMFGPPVTVAEADSCPPYKVLGRQIARVLWRRGGKEADLKTVIVRVRGVAGLDRFSFADLYYAPSQLEDPWAGDPEKPSGMRIRFSRSIH
jgi:hypothetical protein